jgi:hypothetical protein
MTDWYYDQNDNLVEPGSDRRCTYMSSIKNVLNPDGHPLKKPIYRLYECRDNGNPKNDPRARGLQNINENDHGVDEPPPPLHVRHARHLVNDRNEAPRNGGNSTRMLCESPHSVGPSYANHRERWFCRMTDKTLWPFCDSSSGLLHDCFDAEAEVLVEKNRPLAKRSHHWDIVEDWNLEERIKRAG